MIPLFLIPFGIGICIQWIKILIDFIVEKKISFSALRSSWGFPSVHSGISASLTTIMYLLYWIWSTEFAICFVFSFLFRYDAANIRFEAGQHASYLNKISEELDELAWFISHNSYKVPFMLKERLGHTVWEVLWWIALWILMTLAMYTFFPAHFDLA